jgi:hypothetical protein
MSLFFPDILGSRIIGELLIGRVFQRGKKCEVSLYCSRRTRRIHKNAER